MPLALFGDAKILVYPNEVVLGVLLPLYPYISSVAPSLSLHVSVRNIVLTCLKKRKAILVPDAQCMVYLPTFG